MPEKTLRTLNHFAFFTFTDVYWRLTPEARAEFHHAWLCGLRDAAHMVHVYQVFPAESNTDLLIWSVLTAADKNDTARFFECFARATNPFRALLRVGTMLWGYTRPSPYSQARRSAGAIDPFAPTRKPYLVVYPFVKTTEWYLLSQGTRQDMMNEHIQIGKQHADIHQLLLYSFGVQDQEFVVVYEMDDLVCFSELVSELRSTQARRYTLRDTPLHTAIYHPAEETPALCR